MVLIQLFHLDCHMWVSQGKLNQTIYLNKNPIYQDDRRVEIEVVKNSAGIAPEK